MKAVGIQVGAIMKNIKDEKKTLEIEPTKAGPRDDV